MGAAQRCIHFGPGQLGLGLVARHFAAHKQFEFCLVGRPRSTTDRSEHKRFAVSSTGGPSRQEFHAADYVANPDHVDDFDEPVLGWIDDDAPLLVTVALGPKFADAAVPVLRQVFERRPRGAQTLFVTCENDEISCYSDLADEFGDHVELCRAVVDRVCFTRKGEAFDSFGQRLVTVHPVWEWVVEGDVTRSPAFAALEATGVRIVDDIVPWKERKLWIVNGIHQVLALSARREGIDVLRKRAVHEEFDRIADSLTKGIRAAHHSRHPDFEWDSTYVEDRLRVFREAPDTTSRILEEHLRRDNLDSLFERLDKRLFSAASHAPGDHRESFLEVLALLMDVLERSALFYDSTLPVPARDAEILARFDRALADWVPPEEYRRAVHELGLILASSRN